MFERFPNICLLGVFLYLLIAVCWRKHGSVPYFLCCDYPFAVCVD